MAGLFFQLGKKVGPKVRKAQWLWQTVFGSEDKMIAAEKGVGEDLAAEVLRQIPVCTQADINESVSQISTVLALHLRDKRREFNITVIKNSPPNAFALPGGYVFVNQSILDLCRMDKSQIAFIVAHEMAHIVKGHAMERIVMNSAVSFASNLAVVRSAITGWVRKAGIKAIQSSYSRDHELQADALAVRLCRAAGFDPAGAERLFLNLSRCSQDNTYVLNRYFSSHPDFKVRISEINRVLGRV